jgi:DNA polymerase I-like protein with 3'-5' exonuclease and polymerase domains
MIGLQQTLFPPLSVWTPPSASDLPADWNAVGRIGLDTETCDPLLKKLGPGVRRGGFVAGVSFALSEDKGHYLPLRHLGGDNVEDPALALGYIRFQAKRFRGEVVGAKISYDIDYLAELGIHFPHATFLDVQVAEPLLDELQFSYSLDNILRRHGLPQKDETLLREAAAQFKLDPKADLWKMPARFVGPYAEADATLPLKLMRKQEAELELQNLGRVWELEKAVLPILIKMRRRGVQVNLDKLDKIDRWSRAEEMKAWGELQRLTGVAVRVGDAMKAEVIAHALSAVEIACPMTAGGAKTKPKPSITKEFLEALDHPAGKVIRRARKMSQLRSTFVESIRAHEIKGRIHCTFNQLVMQKDEGSEETKGAAYGRLSCSDPNLQQQPARDPEIGPMWRDIYEADEGHQWGSLDYSQQEPRLALHYAVVSGAARIGDAAFKSALAAQQKYIDDPATDSHTMFTSFVHGDRMWDLAAAAKGGDKAAAKELKSFRDPCKNIFLGICYGEGGPKLCRDLGLPTKIIAHWKTGRRMEVAGDEGQALLDLVNSRVPYVKATAEAVEKVAKERGYIVTVGGRRCRFPLDDAGNFDWTYRAFNRAIQGGAADQTKTAMVELDRAGAYLQLQIHDEFAVGLESREEGRRYAEIMEHCVPLVVPSKVDLEMGRSWGTAS